MAELPNRPNTNRWKPRRSMREGHSLQDSLAAWPVSRIYWLFGRGGQHSKEIKTMAASREPAFHDVVYTSVSRNDLASSISLGVVKTVFKYSRMKIEVKAAKKPKHHQGAEGVAVLHKAFDLLDLLQASESAQSLDQLVSASKFPRTTVHRILTDMVSRGYVDRDNAVHYALGEKLLVLGATVRRRLKL